jgi:hypothetical protein
MFKARKGTPRKRGRAAAGAATAGRRSGKSADPDYTQITAYIRRETHAAAKVALIQGGGGRDFSELLEELVAEWLKGRRQRAA